MENINNIKFDPDEVQICSPFSEVNERIETLFKRKREENSDRNTRLYCSSVSDNNYSGSSRTSVTIENKLQQESECYVKKVKVHNTSGPQCNGGIDPASEYSCNLSNNTTLFESKSDVHERISNLEQCLNISNNSHNKFDVYERLKSIENHVLKLENIVSNINENYSLANLFPNNLPTDLINYHDDTEIKLEIKDESINEDIQLSMPYILPNQSKYSVDEIQNLISSIESDDE